MKKTFLILLAFLGLMNEGYASQVPNLTTLVAKKIATQLIEAIDNKDIACLEKIITLIGCDQLGDAIKKELLKYPLTSLIFTFNKSLVHKPYVHSLPDLVNYITYSPDNKNIAFGCNTGPLTIYNTRTKTFKSHSIFRQQDLENNHDNICYLAWSHDSKKIIVLTHKGKCRVLELETQVMYDFDDSMGPILYAVWSTHDDKIYFLTNNYTTLCAANLTINLTKTENNTFNIKTATRIKTNLLSKKYNTPAIDYTFTKDIDVFNQSGYLVWYKKSKNKLYLYHIDTNKLSIIKLRVNAETETISYVSINPYKKQLLVAISTTMYQIDIPSRKIISTTTFKPQKFLSIWISADKITYPRELGFSSYAFHDQQGESTPNLVNPAIIIGVNGNCKIFSLIPKKAYTGLSFYHAIVGSFMFLNKRKYTIGKTFSFFPDDFSTVCVVELGDNSSSIELYDTSLTTLSSVSCKNIILLEIFVRKPKLFHKYDIQYAWSKSLETLPEQIKKQFFKNCDIL